MFYSRSKLLLDFLQLSFLLSKPSSIRIESYKVSCVNLPSPILLLTESLFENDEICCYQFSNSVQTLLSTDSGNEEVKENRADENEAQERENCRQAFCSDIELIRIPVNKRLLTKCGRRSRLLFSSPSAVAAAAQPQLSSFSQFSDFSQCELRELWIQKGSLPFAAQSDFIVNLMKQ